MASDEVYDDMVTGCLASKFDWKHKASPPAGGAALSENGHEKGVMRKTPVTVTRITAKEFFNALHHSTIHAYRILPVFYQGIWNVNGADFRER